MTYLPSSSGSPGAAGASAYAVAVAAGFVGDEAAWLASLKGDAGDSAYAVAVAAGFSGDQATWLASLKGADGTSVTILGTLASTGDLPGSGSAGDAYIIDGDLWVWATSWVDAGPIRGPQGDAGTNGTNGTDGTAATITINSVTTGAAGSSASVTNSGTSTAALLDITIPRGDKGVPGTPGTGGGGGLTGIVDVVADFGADPTGVSDSLAAFNDARNSGAARVWIPPGTYKLSAVLTWDDEVALEGASSRVVSLMSYGAGFGFVHRPASAGSRVPFRGFTIDGTHNTQASTLCGLLVQRKILADDIVIKNFNGAGIRFAPYDASTTSGLGGTIGNAVFFSRWTDCIASDNGAEGFDIRMGANCNGFINCQAIRNKGENWRHRTDGGATYGNWWIGGQGSYGSKNGYSFEGGSDIRTFAPYTEYNHSPTNTNTDGYTGSNFDIVVNVSRSDIDVGVLLNADPAHVSAPSSGSNDATFVHAAGQRIFGSTRYMTGHRVTGPDASVAADVATLKANFNALLTALRLGGHIS